MKAIFLITLVVLIYTSSAELVATMEPYPGENSNNIAGTVTLTLNEGSETTTTLTLALTGLPTLCDAMTSCPIAIYTGTSCSDLGSQYHYFDLGLGALDPYDDVTYDTDDTDTAS